MLDWFQEEPLHEKYSPDFRKNLMRNTKSFLGRQWLRGGVVGWEPEGSQFDPEFPLSLCQSVLEQDSEPWIAPDDQVGALQGFL